MAAQQLDIPSGATTIDTQLFLPEAEGRRPVVILLTDIRGVRPAYEELALSIAARGYAVFLPNVYYRSGRAPVVVPETPFDDGTRARLQGYRALLTLEAQAEDFAAFVAALDRVAEIDAGRIGVVGYCMTGGFALRLAAQFPDRVRAAASFHGVQLGNIDDPASPHRLAGSIKARVHIGHADQDASSPPEQIATLDRALAEASVDFTTEFYAGARHGFAIRDSAAYDPQASARHLRRLLTLFDETLA